MLEIASEIKSKSIDNGSNTTIALKTYLSKGNNLIYKVLVVRDSALIEESPEFINKHDASIHFDMLKKEYGL